MRCVCYISNDSAFSHLGKQITDPSICKDIVYVDKEPLINDLAVGHEEQQRDTLHARRLEHLLERLLEILHLPQCMRRSRSISTARGARKVLLLALQCTAFRMMYSPLLVFSRQKWYASGIYPERKHP